MSEEMNELSQAWVVVSKALAERDVVGQWPALTNPLKALAAQIALQEPILQKKAAANINIEHIGTDALIAQLVARHPDGLLISLAEPGNNFRFCYGTNFHATLGLHHRTGLRLNSLIASDVPIDPNRPRNSPQRNPDDAQ